MTTVLLGIVGVWVVLASLICACCLRMAAVQERQMSPLGPEKPREPVADGVVGPSRRPAMALASTSL